MADETKPKDAPKQPDAPQAAPALSDAERAELEELRAMRAAREAELARAADAAPQSTTIPGGRYIDGYDGKEPIYRNAHGERITEDGKPYKG